MEFFFNKKLDSSFFEEYNEWSYESTHKPYLFGFEKNGSSYSIKQDNNKIIQISIVQDTFKRFNFNLFENEEVLVKGTKIEKYNNYSGIKNNILIQKYISGEKQHLHFIDLDKTDKEFSIEPILPF